MRVARNTCVMTEPTNFAPLLDHHPGQPVADLVDKALRQARELMGADAGALFVLRHESGLSYLDRVAVHPAHGGERRRVSVGHDSIVGHVARTGETVKRDDAGSPGEGPSFDPAIDGPGQPTGALVAFALSNYRGEIVGVVTLTNRAEGGRRFADEHLGLLARFNRVAGPAVERADILERIGRNSYDEADRNARLLHQAEELAVLDDDSDESFRLAISLLARAAEIYDEGTGNHIVRVNEYSHFIARTLGMDEAFCRELRYSAQLHDVGKMTVAPAVLRKTGPLNAEERREMDNHTVYGHRILSQSPRFRMAAEIALNHHEKWDGSGYPAGLRGDDIPLSARIVQMADIYDALRSARPYKPALDHARARDIILRGDERIDSSGHFDPRLVEAFGDTHEALDRIWRIAADRARNG